MTTEDSVMFTVPELLRHLAAVLGIPEGEAFSIAVRSQSVRFSTTTSADAPRVIPEQADAAPSEPRQGRRFSPIEEAILKAATDNWQTAAQLAEATGQKLNQWFYAILGNLADREFLESGPKGYRLK
jgi:hypothetical protein